jgi:hypothetical protein
MPLFHHDSRDDGDKQPTGLDAARAKADLAPAAIEHLNSLALPDHAAEVLAAVAAKLKETDEQSDILDPQLAMDGLLSIWVPANYFELTPEQATPSPRTSSVPMVRPRSSVVTSPRSSPGGSQTDRRPRPVNATSNSGR